MALVTSCPQVRIHLSHLRNNWDCLLRAAGGNIDGQTDHCWPGLMAVVKADAYGHGFVPVTRTLFAQGARAFALGTVGEAVLLQKRLPELSREKVRMVSLLGVRNSMEADAAVSNAIVPLICTLEQAAMLAERLGRRQRFSVAIKVDTGMSRQGFRYDELDSCVSSLQRYPQLRPELLVSHFASADEPDKWHTVAEQERLFTEALRLFRAKWPEIQPSLANSAGLFAPELLPSVQEGHVYRPGYGLYGGNPFAGTALEPKGAMLKPVMEVFAPVLELRTVRKGEEVSYGGSFMAPEDMRVAVIGAGYADGVSRRLAGNFSLCLNGYAAPIVGRVCMQMLMVDVSHIPAVSAGDLAYLLGGEGPAAVTPATLAAAWGSIPYEAFCLLGKNRRSYVR